jgi:hypothetical protein
MASNSKVFVSPGVYTSEVDLSFVSQSVGVTTLGIVGETLRGPAFEPIFIRDFDEFKVYFGDTSPEKFVNTQIPKYEASYIAKAYLQQSNQLFVTRVLGLSGYDAGPSWSIMTVANVDPSTVNLYCTSSVTQSCESTCVEFLEVPYTVNFIGCNNSVSSIVFESDFPTPIQNILTDSYEKFNGTFSTISSDIKNQVFGILNTNSTSATSINYFGSITEADYLGLTAYTSETNVFSVPSVNLADTDLSSRLNDAWYYALFNKNGVNGYSGTSFYSVVSDFVQTSSSSNCADFYSFSINGSQGSINYITNTISVVVSSSTTESELASLVPDFSACTLDVKVSGVTQESGTDSQNFSGVCVVYTLTSEDLTVTKNYTVCVTIEDPCNPIAPNNTGNGNVGTITTCYSGAISGVLYYYTGTSYTQYDNMVVATLRSRGLATYGDDDGAVYEVSGTSDVKMICSGAYSAVTKNPRATFVISGVTNDNKNFSFETSLSTSNTNYITKVFGLSNFDKPRTSVPLFVEERYQTLLNYGYNKGYIRGLNCNILALDSARSGQLDSIGYYLEQYQTPETPWLVSELNGDTVERLFKIITISDGNSANRELKVSIANLSFVNMTFDLIVRDFYDTDSNPVVLEKFTNCSMDPSLNSYVAKKVGTKDGEYALLSKYIMLEVNVDASIDTLPCGFEGYQTRQYSSNTSPFPVFKTKYDFPGEIVYNPPFGTSSGAEDAIRSSGDNVRRTYLGFSTSIGFDEDFFDYKGKQPVIDLCSPGEPSNWVTKTRGFHMDKNASGITIADNFSTSGTPAFYVGDATFQSEPEDSTSPYYKLFSRKFTVIPAGGFDGWDIYREYRTNSDRFVLGAAGYRKGACSSDRYPTATGWGAFRQITIGQNSVDWANTDYYAYLLGIQTFSNPEAVNINVFVTPGIDYVNNSNLVENAIEMVEFNRADSVYITTTPDYNMFVPTSGFEADQILPEEAVDNLYNSGIDSNYTATYYPWVLTRDTVNNTQIYIPPTAEVTRNLALTDNIAFPWFAAAGYTRGIVNAIKARKKLTQEDRDILYKGRINPIATFSDVGTVIWGNKTLQIAESALDRLNVRRLLLQARKLISAVSVRLLFEQNDDVVRQQFLDSVNPILDSIRRDRGLYDFRVTVSSSPEDLDKNQLVGSIYIKPTRSLEFIDITFYITPTGASFENI